MIKRKRIASLVLVLLTMALCIPTAGAMELTDEEQMEDFFSELFGSLHMVVLTTDFVGDSFAVDGQDYTFAAADDSFDYQIMAQMDGEPVSARDNGDGTYTIRNVTGSLLIGCRKIPKLPENSAETPPASSGSVTTRPQTPTVQPTPAPQTPVVSQTPTEPEVVPEEPVPEEPEILPEEPVKEPEPVNPQKPETPAEPAVEIPEQEPFPWWIVLAAVAGIAAVTGIVLLLNRRTVTFVVEGGSAVQPQKVLKGRRAARPMEPEKDGAIFAGWFRDEARTQRWDFENTGVDAHLTLYAKWLAAG